MACQFQMHIAKLLRFYMKTAAHRITDMVGRQFRCVFVLLKELRRVIFVLVVTHASPLMALIYLIWPIPFNGKGSFVQSVYLNVYLNVQMLLYPSCLVDHCRLSLFHTDCCNWRAFQRYRATCLFCSPWKWRKIKCEKARDGFIIWP